MGHWSGVKYICKLNEEDPSFQEIIHDMQKEIEQKHKKEEEYPGESFYATMDVRKGNVEYSSSSYKSRVSNDLSYELLKKIEKNINTNLDKYYYIEQDNGENPGVINVVYGYAKKVAQYLVDAGYADNSGGGIGIYSKNGIDTFHECIMNKEELSEVIKEGEEKRLKREIFGGPKELNEINEYQIYPEKKLESKKTEINEMYLAYWLVYGTEHTYKSKINYYGQDYLNVKEYLYALDYKYDKNKFGSKILKKLTGYGVEFKEGLDSIDAKFKIGERSDCSGRKVTKEIIEQWYQENKSGLTEIPQFSKETAYYLRDNYPATFEKFKIKLKQLHHQYMKNVENNEIAVDKKNPLDAIKKNRI